MLRKIVLAVHVLLLALTVVSSIGVHVVLGDSALNADVVVSFDAKLDLNREDLPPLNISVYLYAEVLNEGAASLPANTVTLELLKNDTVIDSYVYPYTLSQGAKFTYFHEWVPSAEGKYNLTAYAVVQTVVEYIYKDLDSGTAPGGGKVSRNDVRLTAVGSYPAGSTVSSDTDALENLVVFKSTVSPYEKHTENVSVNNLFDSGEYIYQDNDNNGKVSRNDVRLTAVPGYPAGSTVKSGDSDLGWGLIVFQYTTAPFEKHRENVGVNGNYDVGEYIYQDADNSGMVSNNDVRLTAVGSYPAGSAVVADLDIGASLVVFKSATSPYEKHRENVATNGVYDPGEYIYEDKGSPANNGIVSTGDVRLTAVGSYSMGSTVGSGDADVGQTLIVFQSAASPYEKHRENVVANGNYDTMHEADRADNVEWDVVPIFRSVVNPRVYVNPSSLAAYEGYTRVVRVNIANLSDLYVRDETMYDIPLGNLYAMDFYFYYDSSKLIVLSYTVPLNSPVPWIAVDNLTAGTFYVTGTGPPTILNNYPGSSTILEITFRAIAKGTASLTLPIGSMILLDKDAKNIGRDSLGNPDYLSTSNGSIDVRLAGDANGDRIISAPDLFDLGKAYGSTPSNPNWNINCDFNGDNIVNSSDLRDLCKNYGKRY